MIRLSVVLLIGAMAGAVLGIRQKRAAELDALNQEYWALLREASQQ